MAEYKTKEQKKKFYNSSSWKKLRLHALERDNHECQRCKEQGKVMKGQNVHHLKEIYYHPELALEIDNLETLCINCHNEEHERTLDRIRRVTNKKKWEDERW